MILKRSSLWEQELLQLLYPSSHLENEPPMILNPFSFENLCLHGLETANKVASDHTGVEGT